jgi:hypothetical protein
LNKSPELDEPAIEDITDPEDGDGDQESEGEDEAGEQNEDAEDLEQGYQACESLNLRSTDNGSPRPR